MNLYWIGCILTLFAAIDYCNGGSVSCSQVGGASFNNYGEYSQMPVPDCFQTTYTLYTKTETSGVAISATGALPSQFSSSKKTVVIVHGWRDSPTKSYFQDMKDKLLVKGDFNVILADWGDGAGTDLFQYAQGAANSRVAGKAVQLLFQHLVNNGLSTSNTHCIGHSLGAHVCGYAGKVLQFARISAMDPAGPEFEGLSCNHRLCKTDAQFTDVIHTDGGGNYALDYGTLINWGHIDFYPNGGKKQPGCFLNKKEIEELAQEIGLSKKELNTLERVTRGDIGCSHGRAVYLYIESINSNRCKATKKCTDYNKILGGWFSSSSCSSCNTCPLMGYNSIDTQNTQGMFYLETTNGNGKDYCIN